jgi:hypothetical protein
MDGTHEHLTTAKHSIGFAVDDLTVASENAGPTEKDAVNAALDQAKSLFDTLGRLEASTGEAASR